MARSASKKGAPSSTRSRRKTMQHPSKEAQSQVKDKFGKDPWTSSNDRRDDAGSQPSPAQPPSQTSQPPLLSMLIPHFKGSEDKQTNSAPATVAVKSSISDGEEDVAIPTPICAIQPYYQLVAPDGRVRPIYKPLDGMEHLFDTLDQSQGRSSSRPSVTATSQPQQGQALATSQHAPQGETQQQCRTYTHELSALPRNCSEPKPNSLKRSRSRRAREASDVEDNVDHADDEKEEAVAIVNETSKTFQVGDIDGLRTFLRARIDELTMKPVRSMVTSWVKKLEPRRKGGYGPYHKMLPADAPEDATPPWWPRTVPYIEPAHLDKDGLMTLAIDIILQHRDVPVDELKRQMPWTCQLQRVAEFEVSMLPAEQYSSSRNAAFSTAMKERSEQEILPSLFDVVQSYEDHVFQYNLWTYKNVQEAPKGKTITWQLIPRPVKQIHRAKRPRRTVQLKREPLTMPKELTLEVDDESSGNETVSDDTMLRIATELVRMQDLKAAKRKARAAATRAKSTLPASPERTGQISTPSIVGAVSEPATPQTHQTLEMHNANPAISSSFDQHMDHLCLKDETKAIPLLREDRTLPAPIHPPAQASTHLAQGHTPQNSFVDDPLHHEQVGVKGGSFMSSAHDAHQPKVAAQVLNTPMQYHRIPSPYGSHTLALNDDEDAKGGSAMPFQFPAQPPPSSMALTGDAVQYNNRHPGYDFESMGSFADLGPAHYTQFAPPNFINPSDIALFNSCFPAGVQMGQSSYEAAMAANNMDYTYSSEAMFAPLTATVPSTPRPAKSSFNGQPYGFTGPPRQ